MMMEPMSWGVGMMITMAVVGLLVLGAVVAGIVFLFRSLSRRDAAAHGPGAIEVLNERFARGDIDRDEYESRRELLRDR